MTDDLPPAGETTPTSRADVPQPTGNAAAPSTTKRKAFAWAVVLVVLAAFVQLSVVTKGFVASQSPGGWPSYTSFYPRLADAFLHGQTNLRIQPSPELLALPDPYNPRANAKFREQDEMHDVVLFEGKFYIYWGPAPALLLAAICFVSRQPIPSFGDEVLVYAFSVGTLLFTAILLLQIKARLYPEQSWWTLTPALLSVGLGGSLLFILARAAIYEAAILGGQCFLMAGLCAAFSAVSGKPKKGRLIVAGLCWALAIGSRVSLIPAIGALTLFVIFRIWTRSQTWRSALISAVCLALPQLAAGILLAVYNDSRFHSPMEFGMRYQLAGINFHALPNSGFMSSRFVLANITRYLFGPPVFSSRFPFITASRSNPTLVRWFHLPSYYGMELLIGVAWIQPFLIFSLLPLARLIGRRSASINTLPDKRSPKRWLVLSLFSATVLSIAPALFILGSTMRYLTDCGVVWSVLAAMGLWEAYRMTSSRPRFRFALSAAIVLILLAQFTIAFPMALTGDLLSFEVWNPALYHRMQSWFN